MPPKKILDSIFIIPVSSHGQAKSILSRHQESTILYWIPSQDSADKTYPIYLYQKNTQFNNKLSLDKPVENKIDYLLNEGRFSYKQESFEELPQLLKRSDFDAVTQQDVVTYFLNNTYLALPRENQISNKEKWICGIILNHIYIGADDQHNDRNQEKKVYFPYLSEKERSSIERYIIHLAKIISRALEKNCELSYTLESREIAFETFVTHEYFIVLTAASLNTILEYQKITAIPTLVELTYRRLAKIADPLLLKQSNKKIFGLNISGKIADKLKNEGTQIRNDDIKSLAESVFNYNLLLTDPRFSFFSYPDFKKRAVDNVIKTTEYLGSGNSRTNCNII